MAKKPAIIKETAVAAPSARSAKPRTPRVTAAQHSKTASSEQAIGHAHVENPHEAIAQIAYGYWESRGCTGGSALEDWVRAEREYRQRL
jgi:hypothetical protein